MLGGLKGSSLRWPASIVSVVSGQAYAIRLTTTTGWTLVYSGDTRPCENVVQLSQVQDDALPCAYPILDRAGIREGIATSEPCIAGL